MKSFAAADECSYRIAAIAPCANISTQNITIGRTKCFIVFFLHSFSRNIIRTGFRRIHAIFSSRIRLKTDPILLYFVQHICHSI